MASDKTPLHPLPTQSYTPTSLAQSHRLAPPRISFPSATTSSLAKPDDEDDGDGAYERAVSVEVGEGRRRRGGRREGVPKLSRECLISEIKCYGSYILPVLLVFGVLAIGLPLGIYGWKRGWFSS